LFIHKIFLCLVEKLYRFLKKYFKIFQIKSVILLELASYYHRYYGKFEKYFELKKVLLNNLIRYSNHNIYDSSGAKFELYAYSNKKDEKDAMIKIIKYQIAKENDNRISNLKNIFTEKKVLILGPSKISKSINFKDFDLVAVANTKLITTTSTLAVDDNNLVMFINQGYFYRNKFKLLDEAKKVAAIFVKPSIIDPSFPKFVIPNGLMYNDCSPMGVQNILYSIYAGGAKSIYVTGITGFLGEEIFRQGIKTYSDNRQHISNNIRNHEPIANFCLIKNFVNLDLCSGDETFLKIFKNDIKKYCISLDEQYSCYIFNRIDASNLHSN